MCDNEILKKGMLIRAIGNWDINNRFLEGDVGVVVKVHQYQYEQQHPQRFSIDVLNPRGEIYSIHGLYNRIEIMERSKT